MKIPIYQADAFTGKLFGGNPAAVCPLTDWLSDDLMQQIAAENNLSETAFIVPEGEDYRIRWFTPGVEVALCGHATLATAHVFFTRLGYTKKQIRFLSKSGPLIVTRREDGRITLDFPANPPIPVSEVPAGLLEGLGMDKSSPVFSTSFDYMVVAGSQKEVELLQPDFKTLAKVPARGVIVTAKGTEADFVSRCFYPQSGIDEDPVTGSAHTITTSYWADVLKKNRLQAIQLSARRGFLECERKEDRILMTGSAVLYMQGEIEVPVVGD